MNSKIVKHKLLNGGEPTEIFYPVTDSEFKMQIKEIYEDENYGFVPHVKDGIYLDLGANVGMATQYFRNWAKKVYSVEPNPIIYEALVKNVGKYDNVETFNVAWANRSGKNFFYGDKDGGIAQTFFSRFKNDTVPAIVVDCINPKEFFEQNKIEHIDVMKIDIEDAEYILFPDNNFGEITKKVDYIIGEAHFSPTGGFPEVIPQLLEEWGFETTFPKLKHHNLNRTFEYQNIERDVKKKYFVESDTIFVAKKK